MFSRIRHRSPARRVFSTTRPEEKRPYSTEYGFGSTDTEVTLSKDDTHARLVVSDNGIGMSDELLARVFEPFQQAPQSG